MKILTVNGPNLGRLGKREKSLYGSFTLDDLQKALEDKAGILGVDLDFFQSDQEGLIVSTLNQAGETYQGVLINAGAYTHTSIAIRDALSASALPFVEVHISNVHARESFRRHSYLADIAVGVIAGFGLDSYLLGLEGLVSALRKDGR